MKDSWISVDPGFRYFGMSTWQGSELVGSELVEMRSRGASETFIDYRNAGLSFYRQMFSERLSGRSMLVFETMPLNNINTQRVLVSMVIATMLTFAYLNTISVYEVSARTVKKVFTGDSTASKAVMRRTALDKFPTAKRNRKLGEIPFDEMDSIAIGYTFIVNNPEIFKG